MENSIIGLSLFSIIIILIVALSNESICESLLLLLFAWILGAMQIFIFLLMADSLYVLNNLVLLVTAPLVLIISEIVIVSTGS